MNSILSEDRRSVTPLFLLMLPNGEPADPTVFVDEREVGDRFAAHDGSRPRIGLPPGGRGQRPPAALSARRLGDRAVVLVAVEQLVHEPFGRSLKCWTRLRLIVDPSEPVPCRPKVNVPFTVLPF